MIVKETWSGEIDFAGTSLLHPEARDGKVCGTSEK
jgi:hypothetical protein